MDQDADRWASMPATLTASEVAEVLRIDMDTAYRALRSGGIPGRRIGKQWRIDRQVLREWWEGSAP